MQKLHAAAGVVLALLLIGAFALFSVRATAQPICIQTCEWVGEQWICTTICY